MSYGTGNIPFVRTSDISNWEIKTIPKQGVSEDIFNQFSEKQDVKPDDILFVRDGTYLIGTNCFITKLDVPMLYQSHILKLRVIDKSVINPYLLFLSLNSILVQRQIRNMQFTADIIDTIGNRFRELILPIHSNPETRQTISNTLKNSLEERIKYKSAVKQMPILIEKILESDNINPLDDFLNMPIDDILKVLVQDTTTLEFGEFSVNSIKHSKIKNQIFLPKYYDPEVKSILNKLTETCLLYTVQELLDKGFLELSTGDEIGKMAYGTGNIPFLRTSDFSNWEIKSDAKQGVSEEIYSQYSNKQDVRSGDILLVRDGTYLIGTSCIITESDERILYCGGLIKIRSKNNDLLDEFLLLALMNSYIVKRQIRTKQFTRDVIDTLGQRFKEIVIPIPKSQTVREAISKNIRKIVTNRIEARNTINDLSNMI